MTERFYGINTIYGVDGEHTAPYMTRIWIGRLRFHIFYRGDNDPDCHDHPWGFWTFPLRSYVEEVLDPTTGETRVVQVPRLRWSYRPATYAHRVLHSTYLLTPSGIQAHYSTRVRGVREDWSQRIYTLVWRDRPADREWGFWKVRDGKTCWAHWQEYIFNGGKHAPCEE